MLNVGNTGTNGSETRSSPVVNEVSIDDLNSGKRQSLLLYAECQDATNEQKHYLCND